MSVSVLLMSYARQVMPACFIGVPIQKGTVFLAHSDMKSLCENNQIQQTLRWYEPLCVSLTNELTPLNDKYSSYLKKIRLVQMIITRTGQRTSSYIWNFKFILDQIDLLTTVWCPFLLIAFSFYDVLYLSLKWVHLSQSYFFITTRDTHYFRRPHEKWKTQDWHSRTQT